MPAENIEVMERAGASWDPLDRDAWLQTRDPEAEVIAVGNWPDAVEVRGREAAWDFYYGLYEAFVFDPPFGHASEMVAADANAVFVCFKHELRGRSSGIRTEMEYWGVITFRDGKVIRDVWFTDRAEARRAAGLPD